MTFWWKYLVKSPKDCGWRGQWNVGGVCAEEKNAASTGCGSQVCDSSRLYGKSRWAHLPCSHTNPFWQFSSQWKFEISKMGAVTRPLYLSVFPPEALGRNNCETLPRLMCFIWIASVPWEKHPQVSGSFQRFYLCLGSCFYRRDKLHFCAWFSGRLIHLVSQKLSLLILYSSEKGKLCSLSVSHCLSGTFSSFVLC